MGVFCCYAGLGRGLDGKVVRGGGLGLRWWDGGEGRGGEGTNGGGTGG